MNAAGHLMPYPSGAVARDAWIRDRRFARNRVSADRAWNAFVEDELCADGVVRPVATIFLTNRECPFRCLMCDLWRNTLEDVVPPGAIVRQLDAALRSLPPAPVVKLYNSGSFFDPRAIPPGGYEEIASLLSDCSRVIVEAHPAFVGSGVERFRDLLDGDLEVAMGLEIADPTVLERLNKHMTLESYAAASARLRGFGVDVRAFVLVQPPFVSVVDAVPWAAASAAFAIEHGATVVSLIPTRGGNGALDALAAQGRFGEPSLATLEAAFDAALERTRGRATGGPQPRVFVDLWDLTRFASCKACLPAREARLQSMNRTQRRARRVACTRCAIA